MRLRAVGFIVLCGVLGGWGCRPLQTESAPVEVQRRAPDFELPAHDGRSVGLSELLERGPAILVFYRGHW